MQPLMKLVHLLSVIGFLGAAAVALVLAAGAPRTTAEAFAVARADVYVVCFYVACPALLLALTTGVVLMVNRAGLVHARWVQVKAGLGTAIAAVTLLAWLPAVNRIAAYAQSAAFGSPVLDAQRAGEHLELLAGATVLVLAVLAVTVAVYRPRWGRGRGTD